MFKDFGKIARLSRECIVTEKIDGTNAQVHIVSELSDQYPFDALPIAKRGELSLFAGSRNRYLTPEDDNFGFAKWVKANADALWALGEGRHYGEWWGQGIQRGYGLTEKRFSLFNVHMWSDATVRPSCCHVVPVLARGVFDTVMLNMDLILGRLRADGSEAAPGFMNPEGIILFHTASSTLFKKTLEGDDAPKGRR